MKQPLTRYILTATAVAAAATLLSLGVIVGFSVTPLQPFGRLLLYIMMGIGAAFVYVALFEPEHVGGWASNALTGATFGLVMGLLAEVLLLPLAMGEAPRWQPAQVTERYPVLVAYLVLGVAVAILARGGVRIVERRYGPLDLRPEEEADQPIRSRVVILGGGFSGVEIARALESHVEHGVDITLLNDTNHLLFTPMLTEIVSGGVSGSHISPALRTFFDDVHIVLGEPVQLDIEAQQVIIAVDDETEQVLDYDHLALALGSVPRFFGNENIRQHAFTFKSLADASAIRSHAVRIMERANRTYDQEKRRDLLRFIIAGGGFSGAELAGSLNDFVRGSVIYYENIEMDDIEIRVIHSKDRILPELSQELAQYAYDRLCERGVTFRLNSRVTDAAPNKVWVDDEVAIPTGTFIWTAGSRPNPFGEAAGLPVNERGAVITDAQLRVEGYENIWAAGDCAHVPNILTGESTPTTAQFATREGEQVGENIARVLHQEAPRTFQHRALGTLVLLGHQTACAQIRGVRIAGLFAWFMWRAVYLAKLPTLGAQVRVLLDWLVGLFFSMELTYTPTTE